jgi:hypothetical protein
MFNRKVRKVFAKFNSKRETKIQMVYFLAPIEGNAAHDESGNCDY